MQCFLFLMVSACAIPSHPLGLKQQVGRLQTASFPSTLLLSAADSLSFPPLPPPGSQTEACETVVQRVGIILFWLVLSCAMLPATLSFFLHCRPAKQHLAINFLPPAPKEEPHLCRFSPPPSTVLPKDTAAWLIKQIQCTQPSILQAGMQTKSFLRPQHAVSQPPFMRGAQLLTWQTWSVHQWLPLDCQNHRHAFGVHSVGDK